MVRMPHWSSILEFVPNTQRAHADSAALNAATFRANLFNPDAVNIDRVAGGFNCVVQLSAEQCLATFHAGVFWTPFQYVVSAQDLAAFFAADTAPFVSAVLNAMRTESSVQGTYVVTVTPIPVRLRFADSTVKISY